MDYGPRSPHGAPIARQLGENKFLGEGNFRFCLTGLFFRLLQIRRCHRRYFKEKPQCGVIILKSAYPSFGPINSVKALKGFLKLNGSMKDRTSQYISFFPPITQWCFISDVLFTGGRGVSDFSVLKYC